MWFCGRLFPFRLYQTKRSKKKGKLLLDIRYLVQSLDVTIKEYSGKVEKVEGEVGTIGHLRLLHEEKNPI